MFAFAGASFDVRSDGSLGVCFWGEAVAKSSVCIEEASRGGVDSGCAVGAVDGELMMVVMNEGRGKKVK